MKALLLAILVSGCTSTDNIARNMQRDFVSVPEQGKDNWQSAEETEIKKSGDCEDWAIWAQSKLGGAVIVGIRKNGRWHAMLELNDKFYDQFGIYWHHNMTSVRAIPPDIIAYKVGQTERDSLK